MGIEARLVFCRACRLWSRLNFAHSPFRREATTERSQIPDDTAHSDVVAAKLD